ncbi:uncharacterized protein [Apostichopus japonicus]|uniref:uncharacterized protein isoform X2 n=2 Tax=Stichopus japonicus TaxID=307972 RepID=UPI003AB24E7F
MNCTAVRNGLRSVSYVKVFLEMSSNVSKDDSFVRYRQPSEPMATTAVPTEKPAKISPSEHKAKKSSWTNIFKPWKWRKKKKDKENKNGDKPTEKVQDEDNNVNHVSDSNEVPSKPERNFNSESSTVELPKDGDHGDDSAYRPLVTTEVQINQSEGNSIQLNNQSREAQINSTVHSSSEDNSHQNGQSEEQPPLPPKAKSPERQLYRPTPAPRTPSESPLPPSKHSSGEPKRLNFSGEVVVNNSAENEHYEDSDSDYDNNVIHYRDDDDEEDEDEEPSSLAAKVKRNDSLAFHLNNRPSRTALVERNIIPISTHDQIKVKREQVGAKLVRRLSERPTKDELEQRNIYKDLDNEAKRRAIMEEKKRTLVRKLSFRPTVEELRERNIIMFNEYVEVIEALTYDRRGDKPWTKLTPQDKASIRKELNEFKSNEMAVHADSKKYTRFHKP